MSEEPRPVDWGVSGLAQLLDTVLTVADRSGDLADHDREQFAETGAAAFNAGLGLSGLIDSYLAGAGEVWEHVFARADPAHTVELSRSLRRVSQHAISSLVEGFESAQRLSIRAEESQRRTFLDVLLDPHSDSTQLTESATQLGFPAFDIATVAVAGTDRGMNDGGPAHRRIKAEIESRAPHRQIVVTAKQGRIVFIATDASPAELAALVHPSVTTLPETEWHIGLGDRATTLRAVATSYQQAIDAMRIARVFGLTQPAEFTRILPQRLLSADGELTRTLVAQVLDPLLANPRGDLLATLGSFIEHGGNMADVARELNIGSRTVAYRLDRIAQLTGCSPRLPDERFVLELAYRSMPLTAAVPRRA